MHHDSDEVQRWKHHLERQERHQGKEGNALKGSGNIRSHGTADLTELETMVGTVMTLAGGERV
jgi:hypothetical protein